MTSTKQSEVRRFLGEEVIGQLRNGLFFEALVGERDGKLTVIEGEEALALSAIKWLATVSRYC